MHSPSAHHGPLAAAREFQEALGRLLKPVQDSSLPDRRPEQPSNQEDDDESNEDEIAEDAPVKWKSQADARRRAEAMVRSLERRAIDPQRVVRHAARLGNRPPG